MVLLWGVGRERDRDRETRRSYFPSNDIPTFWSPNPEDERMLGELGQRGNTLKTKGCFSVVICLSLTSIFRHFWRKSLRTPEPGFYLISSFWPSLPSSIDAAYEVANRDTVFVFKGAFPQHCFNLVEQAFGWESEQGFSSLCPILCN